jgi:PKD repeat protein
MLVADVFSVELYNQSTDSFEDITSGILNVDILHGTDVYEGPYQQIDTGQFTVVSRNPNLDPKINPSLRFGSFIQFLDSRNVEEGKTNRFFGGWVTDIDVQYQREDDPIITITGTDIFGLYQQSVVTEDIERQGRSWASGVESGPDENGISLYYLANMQSWTSAEPGSVEYIIDETPGQIEGATPGDNYSTYAPARYLPKVGETLLDILNKYTQTNLNYCSVEHRISSSNIKVYPFAKYNSFYWPPMQDPALEFPTLDFSSDPADGRPYETILINNGYRRVTNSITVSNETRTLEDPFDPFNTEILSNTITYAPFVDSESNTEYGTTRLNLDTIIATAINDEERYAKDIFQVVAFASDEIQQITFDNARKEDIDNDYTYSFSQLNQFTRIKHQVSETETINRFYDIAGIRHSITPDKWEMSFTFKPSQQEIAFTYQGQVPTIQMNSLTGDSNFNFTATITDYPTEDIEEVIWCLNGTNNFVPEQWFATVDGSRYKDNTPRNGLTQTWNFDDDGILQGPDFPTGGYGSGEWYVIPYIILKNGWVIAPNIKLTVGTPEVAADFLWSQNLTNNFGQVTFTDDSRNNEIGEPDSYLWNFGDGTTSTLKNPVKVYDPSPTTTTYSVSLTVFAYGIGDEKVYNTKTKTITLVQPTMVPNFTSTVNNQVVTFTNTSTNVGFEEPDAYLWEFGDGTTSTEKNPVHTFPVTDVNVPQSFSVKLTTRNIWEQTASVTKTVTTTGLNQSGTLPVSTLRLRIDPTNFAFNPSATYPSHIYFYMFDLKARTSNTKANLTFLRPTTRTNSSNIVWYEADGTIAESSDEFNLTRPSSGIQEDQYGLSPFTTSSASTTTFFNLDTSISVESRNIIKDILLTIRDVGPLGGSPNGGFYGIKVYVDVPDSFGGWVNIGYYQHLTSKADPTRLPYIPSTATKTMTAVRPMPMNIPYFKYTFNNMVASFTSMETGVSYAWNFGDGTTSTLKDPVKTFNKKGTYNVSLTVTFAGGGTRTTTEPVIVEYIAKYPVRYVKFVQNLHTGVHAFDTPYIDSFSFKRDSLDLWYSVTGEPSPSLLTFAKTDVYSNEYRIGTSGETIINPITSPNNARLAGGGGFRVKSLDGSNRTEWEMTLDLGRTFNNLTNCSVRLGRWTATGFPETIAAGINYSVFVTDYAGTQAGIGSATWTKLGDFTPTSMPLNNSSVYQIALT